VSSIAPVARRAFVRVAIGARAAAPFAARALAENAALTKTVELERLIEANRILAREEIVDAFGHVSIRDPENTTRDIMARSRSPELVEHADLIRFEQDGRSQLQAMVRHAARAHRSRGRAVMREVVVAARPRPRVEYFCAPAGVEPVQRAAPAATTSRERASDGGRIHG
jgi:hypothetical protein